MLQDPPRLYEEILLMSLNVTASLFVIWESLSSVVYISLPQTPVYLEIVKRRLYPEQLRHDTNQFNFSELLKCLKLYVSHCLQMPSKERKIMK